MHNQCWSQQSWLVTLIACLIYNGNWTEWSAVWSEIIRVISKSNERLARVRFEITSMISDQNCTPHQFNCHFIRSILKSHNLLEKSNNNKVLAFVVAKFSTKWLSAFHFPEILLITVIEHWNLIGCFVLLSYSHWQRKWCDLEQEMVRFGNKSHHWEPIRLQG